MSDVVSWLRDRARALEARPYGALAAAALTDAADALELVERAPESAP